MIKISDGIPEMSIHRILCLIITGFWKRIFDESFIDIVDICRNGKGAITIFIASKLLCLPSCFFFMPLLWSSFRRSSLQHHQIRKLHGTLLWRPRFGYKSREFVFPTEGYSFMIEYILILIDSNALRGINAKVADN